MSAFLRFILALFSAFSRRPATAAPPPKIEPVEPQRKPEPVPLPPPPAPAPRIKPKHVAVAGGMAGAIAIAAPLVGGFEGERLKAYRDVVGIPTACDGETRGIKMGMTFTHEQCQQMLAGRLAEFAEGVRGCVTVPMSDNRYAASISLAYNIGTGAFCRSSFVRALNAGDPNACDRMLAFDRAGGREIEGLKRRREAERKLCKA